MRLLIATPSYGGDLKTAYVNALFTAIKELERQGVEVSLAIVSGSLIGYARDMLVHQFLNSKADTLMFIDADEGGWTASDILALAKSGYSVCGAVVPMKGLRWDAISLIAKSHLEPNDKRELSKYGVTLNLPCKPIHIRQFNGRTFGEVPRIGAGFMCIQRAAFEKIEASGKLIVREGVAAPRMFFPTDSENHLGEDHGFCALWTELGERIGVLLDSKITHVGSFTYEALTWDQLEKVL
jgi:hypothetical protein